MGPIDLAYAGIARQAELIAAGDISSRELVELYLERIARYDSRLNAFRVVLAERALLEADQADARRGAGGERPLLGVPIAVKDDIDLAGEVTTLGTNARGGPAVADAEVVRRLREAGAVVIGKTNVPELCVWPFTETATFGATRNPWDLQRAPGGSSGGSAAAVAAGLVGAALGSDGAGSIRIPSAWCGLFGLKAQRGRVSMAPRPRAWHGLSVNGVLTRRVADTALFHDVASGAIDVDEDHAPAPSVPFAQALATGPGRLRIAYSTRMPPGVLTRLDGDAERALRDTVELLRSLGHHVSERDPDYGMGVLTMLIPRYLRGVYDDAHALEHPERLERRSRGTARLGRLIPASALERSLAGEADFTRRLNRVFEDHDVLLTPSTATPPPRIGQLQGRGALWTLNAVAGMVPFNGVWNVTGQPAASVPAGFGADGLPRGVQLVGRPNDEATLLALAGQIEAERPWAEQRPAELVSEADELLAVAVEAATTAGVLLAERVLRGAEREIASKSTPTDLVSEADLASERAIRELLARRRPADGFVGEEEAPVEGTSGLSWIVDPLDGTVNFLFGIPQWCVSVAVRDADGTLAGAVYDPNRDELFSATRDGRATLVGPRGEICLGEPRTTGPGGGELASAMVATGLAYDADVRAAQAKVLARLAPRVRDIRRFGSAALDLTWTAAGRFDAYFERTVKPWDIAAGALICERAGLRVIELPVHDSLPWGILVAGPALAEPLLGVVGGP